MGHFSARNIQTGQAMQTIQKLFKHTDLLIGVGMLLIVAMLILPLPDFLLDLGLVVAISTSVVIMLTSVNVKEPLHFSVFPSLLMVTTLLRLALSVAATKLILGTGHAGHVIETFGQFVLGGNFVVGFVSFLILMIVQFIVITQGATRVSEVVARFTLDAMPGKQMAIDADLASGLIDEEGARTRRKAVKAEADFYGAMDGASKFVKGDAIASILIIIVNIIGGFIMGYMRGEGDIMQTLSTYALLSVGEGLCSQIPALLISTASGLLVTRNGQEAGMGGTMFSQLLAQPRVLATTGIAMGAFAFVPGFPTFIFLGIGALLYGISRIATKNPRMSEGISAEDEKAATPEPLPEVTVPTTPEAILPLVNVDPVEIEIGYSLTRLADQRVGGDLSERVGATRRQIANELGYVMPSVRIRDNAALNPLEYVLKIRGEEVGRAIAQPNNLLAINSGSVVGPVPGAPTTEPVFGLEAVWIDQGMRETAERNGYTVIAPAAMITTHLAEVIKSHAAELLSRQEVASFVDSVKETNAALVNALEPAGITIGEVQKVLQHLLREKVPIRDLVTILETIADYAGRIKDMEQMGELVRASIARTITRQYLEDDKTLSCITLDSTLENLLLEGLQQTAGGVVLAIDPLVSRNLVEDTQVAFDTAATNGRSPVLLCTTQIRLGLRKLFERNGKDVPVLSYNEVAANVNVEFVGSIDSQQDAPTAA